MILCFTVQAVGCLTPRRRPSSTDEMPFFAVTIRWMAANQSVSGSLVAWKIVGRCLLLAVALIEAPTRQHAIDGRSRGRGSRPASAAGAAPRGTAPRCRRPPETPRRSDHAARCNLEPHNRDPLIRNILRTYSLTCGVSRISRKGNDFREFDHRPVVPQISRCRSWAPSRAGPSVRLRRPVWRFPLNRRPRR